MAYSRTLVASASWVVVHGSDLSYRWERLRCWGRKVDAAGPAVGDKLKWLQDSGDQINAGVRRASGYSDTFRAERQSGSKFYKAAQQPNKTSLGKDSREEPERRRQASHSLRLRGSSGAALSLPSMTNSLLSGRNFPLATPSSSLPSWSVPLPPGSLPGSHLNMLSKRPGLFLHSPAQDCNQIHIHSESVSTIRRSTLRPGTASSVLLYPRHPTLCLEHIWDSLSIC